jgi:hypoxanthine phosphoribosyltransferase
MDLTKDIAGKDVLIVEDILDSGRTLAYLISLLEARNPASIRICTLFDKPSRRQVDVHASYSGIEVPDEFIVGYGLDYNEKYRNLPFIGVLKPEIYNN